MKPNQPALRAAFLTEVQAVAIYEGECWILRRSRLPRASHDS